MVSDGGDGWLGVGPIRGPRALMTPNGKVYGRKDAAGRSTPTATAVSQLQ
jgi:hypothetical protein